MEGKGYKEKDKNKTRHDKRTNKKCIGERRKQRKDEHGKVSKAREGQGSHKTLTGHDDEIQSIDKTNITKQSKEMTITEQNNRKA